MPFAHDEARAVDTVSVASRHYLASEHLWTALHGARQAQQKEDTRTQGVGFSPEHQSHVISSLLASVAFIEAVVNEVFEDAADSNTRVAALGARCLELMAETWATAERSLSALDKYQSALLFADKPRFKKGENPYQDVDSVILIRNNLIHFKPRWHTHGEAEQFKKRLRNRFPLNPYLAGSGNPWFPGKMLSAGCAEWAVKACRTLAQEWSDRLGLPRHFDESINAWSEKP
jgi:hypothetical protein